MQLILNEVEKKKSHAKSGVVPFSSTFSVDENVNATVAFKTTLLTPG